MCVKPHHWNPIHFGFDAYLGEKHAKMDEDQMMIKKAVFTNNA